MKKLLMGALVVMMVTGCNHDTVTSVDTKEQKVSYALGHNIGFGFKDQDISIDQAVFFQGIKDGISGNELMKEAERQETLVAFQKEMMAKFQEKKKVAVQENLKKGQEYLANNKSKPGVVTTPSGLQYKVIQSGTGATSPTLQDTVSVHYKGTLIDGTEFDSSYKRNAPASFRVGGVIAGWTEALQIMKPGDKWELIIPPSLAYGENGAGAQIGPNEVLIFEVELLSIN